MYDVAVIGLGRVGLPLALAFADAGLRVLGIDKDADRLDAVRAKRMPFKEPGTDELLARVELDVSSRASDAAQSDAIVLTLGTPTRSASLSTPMTERPASAKASASGSPTRPSPMSATS